jgi:hypothetical protein
MAQHRSILCSLWACAALAGGSVGAATPLHPTHGEEVIEVLQSVTRVRLSAPPTASAKPDLASALQVARAAVQDARQSGEARYWGRAQAALSPWWDAADAPSAAAVLQATVQQGRHEFTAARQVLINTVAREPGNAQAWLNLAALERLSGQYPQALHACAAVARAGQALYAQACALETQSLQGRHQDAATGLRHLLAQSRDREQSAWLLSLAAENEERAGHDGAAHRAYVASLSLAPDLYTSLAYSDLQLRTGQPALALQTLSPLPATDAVLLRRARAMQRLNQPAWASLRATLREREQALQQRGDDLKLHGRERALTALWLDHDPRQALVLARDNLKLQREPIDWWLALHSAYQASDTQALANLQREVASTGLRDARLTMLTLNTPKRNQTAIPHPITQTKL